MKEQTENDYMGVSSSSGKMGRKDWDRARVRLSIWWGRMGQPEPKETGLR
jgi:hypothetical protein